MHAGVVEGLKVAVGGGAEALFLLTDAVEGAQPAEEVVTVDDGALGDVVVGVGGQTETGSFIGIFPSPGEGEVQGGVVAGFGDGDVGACRPVVFVAFLDEGMGLKDLYQALFEALGIQCEGTKGDEDGDSFHFGLPFMIQNRLARGTYRFKIY